MDNNCSFTLGIVVQLNDPNHDKAHKNKVKVRIPQVHGPMKQTDLPYFWANSHSWTDDDHLPWVPIMYPLGTRTPNKSLLREKEIVYLAYMGDSNSVPTIVGTTTTLVKE